MATPDDAAAVCALYNWYVRHGVQTFQYAPSTVEDYRVNIEQVLQNAPFLLAESADGRLQGFACAHPWRTREAFAWDVETTVYCAPDCVGQGVGGRLYRALLALLKQQGYHQAYALVTGCNTRSKVFHKALEFKKKSQWNVIPATSSASGWIWNTGCCPCAPPDATAPAPVRKTLTAEEIARVL